MRSLDALFNNHANILGQVCKFAMGYNKHLKGALAYIETERHDRIGIYFTVHLYTVERETDQRRESGASSDESLMPLVMDSETLPLGSKAIDASLSEAGLLTLILSDEHVEVFAVDRGDRVVQVEPIRRITNGFPRLGWGFLSWHPAGSIGAIFGSGGACTFVDSAVLPIRLYPARKPWISLEGLAGPGASSRIIEVRVYYGD